MGYSQAIFSYPKLYLENAQKATFPESWRAKIFEAILKKSEIWVYLIQTVFICGPNIWEYLLDPNPLLLCRCYTW